MHEAAEEPVEDHRIVGEVALRLIELDEVKVGYAASLVRKLDELHRLSPAAFNIALVMLTGDSNAATESFAVQALKRGTCKQAIHCELRAALRKIEAAFPEVAQAIRQVRTAAAAPGEQISSAEAGLLGCSREDTQHF